VSQREPIATNKTHLGRSRNRDQSVGSAVSRSCLKLKKWVAGDEILNDGHVGSGSLRRKSYDKRSIFVDRGISNGVICSATGQATGGGQDKEDLGVGDRGIRRNSIVLIVQVQILPDKPCHRNAFLNARDRDQKTDVREEGGMCETKIIQVKTLLPTVAEVTVRTTVLVLHTLLTVLVRARRAGPL